MSELRDVALPAIRSDLAIEETGSERYPWTLVDPATGRKLGLDAIGRVVVAALSEPRTALEVLGFAHGQGEDRLEPRLLRKHVSHLRRHGMLEGARAERIRATAAAADDAVAQAHLDLPMVWTPGLKHACQASGSCCSATDVGPIPEPVVQEILGCDWTRQLEGVEKSEDLFRRARHGEHPVVLTAMRHDQCVFLADDKLCSIHERLGLEKKPRPCRQFPYVFARTGDTLSVSLQLECRAYWEARQAAPPMAESEAELRELLRGGAPVHSVPSRIVIDSGLWIARSEYVELEEELIAAVRVPDPDGGIWAPITAYARAAERAFARTYAEIDAEEDPWTGPQAWREAFPGGAFGEDPDLWENFFAHLERFRDEVAGFAEEAAGVASERGLKWLAPRFRFLARAVIASCGGTESSSFRFTDPEAARGILEDVIVSTLFAKEPVRRGAGARFGLALAGMRAVLTLAGACDRAKEACRVEVGTQDLVDSMVTIGKMLREESVLDVLKGMESTVTTVFLTNLEVFGKTAEPRLGAFGGIR